MPRGATNPFTADDDNADEANRAALAEMENDLDDSEEAPGESRDVEVGKELEHELPKESREQKKRARGRTLLAEAQERIRQLEESHNDERQRRIAIETNVQLERDRVQREEQNRHKEDPLDVEEKRLYEEQRRIAAQFEQARTNKTLTEALATELEARNKEIMDRRMDIRLEKREKARPAPQGVNRDDLQMATVRTYLELEHQDVVSNPRARAYATAEHARLLALGKPNTKETVDMAMNAARQNASDLGFTPSKPLASQSAAVTRRQFSGASVGGSGGAGGGAGQKGGRYTPTKAEEKMAMHMYPSIAKKHGKAAAVQKWVNEVHTSDDPD